MDANLEKEIISPFIEEEGEGRQRKAEAAGDQ